MNSSRSPRFRPNLETMETKNLLSGGVSTTLHAAGIVHAASIVDLKPTTVGADALNALNDSVPHHYRRSLAVTSLSVDTTSGKVAGSAIGVYRLPIIGNLNVTVRFSTSVDHPRPSDVKVTLSKFNGFLRASDRNRVALAVVNFLQTDHDTIVALEKPKA